MIQLHKSEDGKQWFYIVKASNGKTLCHSETFKTKASALKSIAALKKAINGKIKDLS